jgi:maltose O-acetyltransferase
MIMENYYSLTDEKIIQARKRAQKLCVEYNEKVNQENFYDEALLNALLKKVGRAPYVEPNFRCFLGSRIELGDEVFLNHDVTLQDMAEITIGSNVNIAPRTGIFTEFCPKEKELRRKKIRYAKPVVIEDGVWLGGNVTVWGGVTIGKNSIIGAGSVVTADIPENVIAVGNPAKVIKKIETD